MRFFSLCQRLFVPTALLLDVFLPGQLPQSVRTGSYIHHNIIIIRIVPRSAATGLVLCQESLFCRFCMSTVDVVYGRRSPK